VTKRKQIEDANVIRIAQNSGSWSVYFTNGYEKLMFIFVIMQTVEEHLKNNRWSRQTYELDS
jgi:hypothetical protein